MDHTKVGQADLDAPRQELSVCGLQFVVFFVVGKLAFVCVYWESNPDVVEKCLKLDNIMKK